MKNRVDFEIDLWDSETIFDLIIKGRLGLPDFQRRFEWSSTDVKAFLSTVLGGLPSGAIMVADNRAVGVALRELEGAPPLSSNHTDILALLDGQQRLTALFQASFDLGPDEYLVDFSALESGASVLEDDVLVSHRRNRPYPRNVNPENLVPFSALANDHSFFSWLSQTRSLSRSTWGDVFSEKIQTVSRYQIPVTRLGGALDLATVAQVFERTNKWGQRLDAFDLLVARLKGGGWSLRSSWEEATTAYPAIGRVFGDNGLVAVSAIALRELGDVRRNTVLALEPGRIERQWDESIRAVDHVARLLLGEGVRKPELLPYDSLATAVVAARLDGVDDELMIRYYWLASMNRWHESASNTRVKSDFRFLASGGLDPSMPTSLPPVEELMACTRRSSRALSAAMLGAAMTAAPHDLVTGQPVSSSSPEDEDMWQLVSLVTGGASRETHNRTPTRLRTAAQVFASPGVGQRLRRYGLISTLRERLAQPSFFSRPVEEDMASQLLPSDLGLIERMSPSDLVDHRAWRIWNIVSDRLSQQGH